MDKIELRGIRLYSNHGCLDEEAKIGTEYQADLSVWGDLEKAMNSDQLEDTIDYVVLNRIVTEEALKRSKLLEEVVLRIEQRIFSELPAVQKLKLRFAKISPPINGDVASVSVEIKRKRRA